MIYSFESRIRYSEIDQRGRLSLPSLINYFQDCSTFHSEDIGLGYEKIRKRGRVWVLSSWHIEIIELPKLGDEVKVKTFATSFKGTQGNRNFIMVNVNDKVCAYANSIWVLVDTNSGMLTRITEEDYKPYGTLKALEMEPVSRKIERLENAVNYPTLSVLKQHLDTNNHVNNGQYVQMALEILAEDIPIKRLRVEYKKPAVYGDVIYPKMAQDSTRTVIELQDEGGNPYTIVEII